MLSVAFFIFGLIVGSFLNVVVVRLRSSESFLVGRSRCPQCKVLIRWHDNVPLVSFVLLRARCRNCGGAISAQYPLVELATGALFALLGKSFFVFADPVTWFATLCALVAAAALVVIFVYDLRFMEIPMAVAWIAIGSGALFAFTYGWENGIAGTLSAIGAFAFFAALTHFSNERWMGAGDAYVAAAMGLLLGWPLLFLGLLVAFCLGACVGIALIAFGNRTLQSQVPFAPFLIVGLFLTFFLEAFDAVPLPILFS